MVQNIIHQYKKSAILLEVNDKFSSSKQTKHTKIRYISIDTLLSKVMLELHNVPLKICVLVSSPNRNKVRRSVNIGHY